MRGKYGDVVTISLTGGVKWVILNSPNAIQEGFVKQACLMSERHSSYSGTLYNCKLMYLTDSLSIIMVNGTINEHCHSCFICNLISIFEIFGRNRAVFGLQSD